MKTKTLAIADAEFKVKALEDGSVYLEGWANKSIVDRGKDIIGKKSWDLDNFKKNSIMLFNHDHSKPIGKFIAVEAKDEGLFVKGRISNSKDPEISRIRDLVKEGILNSLSVGINVKDEEHKDGVNHLKSVELHEVSVVSVPMNQDSQFTVSTKALSQGSMLDSMTLLTGASGYKDVHDVLEKLHKEPDVYESIDAIAEAVSLKCNIDKETAQAFIRMKSDETPEEVKEWLEEEEEGKDKKEGMEVFSVSVPKAAVASREELEQWATASGWKFDQVTETDDAYVLVQLPADQLDGELRMIDMGDGVTAQIGKPKAAEAVEEIEETETEDKGLLDDQNPMTVPIEGRDPTQIEVNPSLDQARQTNVLLASLVQLMQQLNEKFDMIAQTPKAQETVTVADPIEPAVVQTESDEELQLAKKIETFMIKTNERLSLLGL